MKKFEETLTRIIAILAILAYVVINKECHTIRFDKPQTCMILQADKEVEMECTKIVFSKRYTKCFNDKDLVGIFWRAQSAFLVTDYETY